MLYEPIKEDATAPPEWRQAHFICLFIAVNFIGSGEIFSLLNVSSYLSSPKRNHVPQL